jgi:uncharacterized protein (UPF0332 family)
MIDPAHLLQLAGELASPTRGKTLTGVRLRRAVSTAYYAAFHDLCRQASDMLVGKTERASKRYGLVYRFFDHREMRAACLNVTAFGNAATFGVKIKTCARNFVALQAARLEADYDPSENVTLLEVQNAINQAQEVISALRHADDSERKMFLTSFKFGPRA